MYSSDFFNFIKDNIHQNTDSLRLKLKASNFDFNLDEALTQIDCRRKHSSKLRLILENEKFIFPDRISGEQSSHQAIAKYHALIAKDAKSVLDMTAGLGIDDIFLAKNHSYVTAVEIDSHKAECLRYNAKVLSLDNISVINADSLQLINSWINGPNDNKDISSNLNFINQSLPFPPNQSATPFFDLIFVDPSRRDTNKKRLYNLRDCSPDIINNQELLLQVADRVLIKASPLLDISQTISDFNNIHAIRCVGVKGECKEMLIELKKSSTDNILLEAIDLDVNGNILSSNTSSVSRPISSDSDFNEIKNRTGLSHNENESCENLQNTTEVKVVYAKEEDLIEGSFILEPSAMVMKLAPWAKVCTDYNAKKFDKSSHIFISPDFPANFPGRVTKFERLLNKQDRKTLRGFPASIVSRNHPVSSEDLRKTLHLKEGDDNFIYATRLEGKPIIFLSSNQF